MQQFLGPDASGPVAVSPPYPVRLWLRAKALRINRAPLLAFASFCGLTGALLYFSGAFTHELGGGPDEAAHYVTGLMVRDYAASGAKVAPMEFAKEYYRHFPKVAFGIWPPLFHVIEATWMLVASPSKASVVIMLGLITAMLAFLLFRTVERQFGFASGVAAGLLLVTVPLMQQSTAFVMADSTVALFSFLAILRFARYLDGERWQDAALFGVWSAAAILSKYNGAALALAPLLCLAITGRWNLLKRWRTWLPAGIVVLLCAPWYLPMWKMLAYAAEPLPSLATVAPVMQANALIVAGTMGVPILLVAHVGMWSRLYSRHRRSARDAGIWVAAFSLIAACCIFHSVVSPYPDARYMLPVLPPLILFLAAGIKALSARLALRPVQVAGVILVLYLAGAFRTQKTPRHGYADLATAISRGPARERGAVLVDGSETAEGMLISEVALRDRERRLYVFRGSKLLATSTWMGERYRANYDSLEAVRDALDRAGISTVVVAASSAPESHHRMLTEMLESKTETWQRWAEPAWQSGEHFRVYRRTGTPRASSCVDVSLEYTLGGHLTICPGGQVDGGPAGSQANRASRTVD